MQINCLNLLLVLLLGVIPCKIHATDTKESVMLYTPYTKISVPPGESIDYSVDVINKSDEVKNATISVEGMPRGWSYEVKSGGFTISRLHSRTWREIPNQHLHSTQRLRTVQRSSNSML